MTFPSNPNPNDTYTFKGVEYTWNGKSWTYRGADDDDADSILTYSGPFVVPFNPATYRTGRGGYEFTGAFTDKGTPVNYTQTLVDAQRWYRFGTSTAAQVAQDIEYWGELRDGFDQTKGVFGGLSMPQGVTDLFQFDDTSISAAVEAGSLQYTAANGTLDLSQCKTGDLVLVRLDINVTPQVANTTLETGLIYANRNEADSVTFTFPLVSQPIFYGTGTVGKTYLNRQLITAYIASDEDLNSRSLPAIRSDNPVIVEPLSMLVTIIR